MVVSVVIGGSQCGDSVVIGGSQCGDRLQSVW